jgi:hypothetical protein
LAALVLLGYAIFNGESLAIVDAQTLVMLIIYGVWCSLSDGCWSTVRSAHSLGVAGPYLAAGTGDYLFHRRDFLGKASSTFQVCGALLTIFAVYIGSIRPPEKVQPLPPAKEQKSRLQGLRR